MNVRKSSKNPNAGFPLDPVATPPLGPNAEGGANPFHTRGENSLVAGKLEIAYDSIQKIDKTHFDSKGYFIITYKDYQGVDADLRVSDRTYDNLSAVLDELIGKIS